AGLRENVVLAREDTPGQKRLVAYVVAKADAAPTVAELRAHLKEKLPEYMVPQAFVMLEALPLTPNGKVDRKALPAPEGNIDLGHEYVAPRTPTEELLVGLWGRLLGVEKIGREHNFFELGGHSLLATQLVSRIRETCKVELGVRSIFEAPTIAALGRRISE